MKDNSKK